MELIPKYPLYIPTKGRFDVRLTSDYLSYIKVNHHLVIEKQEFEKYRRATKDNNFVTLLVLDKRYQDEYDTFDKLGDRKSKGPGAARNFAWDHSIDEYGSAWHWVMDDNIRDFYRFNNNLIVRVKDGTIFSIMEDFCERYENVGMAGPNYEKFVIRKKKYPPFIHNTRIYSCNLIRNDVPLRWRGRYNEDTDLSLRMIKKGWCTIQFNAFLQGKVCTQKIKGGNTKEFYSVEGTLPKSKMQVAMHPDCSKLVWKFNRWHHYVDYSRFKKIKLIRKKDIKLKNEVNDYGMKIVRVKK